MKAKTPDGEVHDLSELRACEVARFMHMNDAVPVVEKAEETRPAKRRTEKR